MDFGRSARLLGHVGGEREIRPVDDAAHDRREARNADHSRIRGGSPGKSCLANISDTDSLCTGTKVAAAAGRAVRHSCAPWPAQDRSTNSTIGSIKRRRASCRKPISAVTAKNWSNGAVAEIDDLRARRIRDQPVEQLHLAACVDDVHGPDQLWETGRERRLARIEVVADQRPAAGAEKFDHQPRDQRLAGPRAGRRDNVEGSRPHIVMSSPQLSRLRPARGMFRSG